MPTVTWGAVTPTAKGAAGESSVALDHNLTIENGWTTNGEKWADINGSGETTVSTDVRNHIIYAAYASNYFAAAADMSGDVSLTFTSTDGITFSEEVYGGYAKSAVDTAAANTNKLIINGRTFKKIAAAGYVTGGLGAAVSNNTLAVTGNASFEKSVYGGYAESQYGSVEANENKLTINGGSFIATAVNHYICGGYAKAAGNGTAEGNEVNISGEGTSVTPNVYGAYAESTGADSSNKAKAAGNTLTISSGTFSRGVIAAYAYSKNGTAEASGNTLTISGGTFNSKIRAAYACSDNGTAEASDNTMIIEGSPILNDRELYGGITKIGSTEGAGTSTGNTLKIRTSGLTAKNIKYFQKYDFTLPSSLQSGDTTPVLTLTASEGTNVENAAFTVTLEQGSSLKAGDSVNLLYNVAGIAADETIKTGEARTENGVASQYIFIVYQSLDHKYIVVDITEAGSSDIYGSLNNPLNHAIVVTQDGKTEPAADWESPAEDTIAGAFVFGVKNDKSEEGGDAIASMGENGSMTIMGTGSDSPDNVYGAYAFTLSGRAEAKDSLLSIEGGTFTHAVYSGYANGSESATANDNTMTISGGTFNNYAYSGNAYSQNGSASANNNTLTIFGGTFHDDARAGFAHAVPVRRKPTSARVQFPSGL